MIIKHNLFTGRLQDKLQRLYDPPKQLYIQGSYIEELLERPAVAIVGTRKITSYGKQVTEQLARTLAQHGVTIISGLAFGVDAAAHQACLNAGGRTIAVLPGPIENIYPATHRHLAEHIIHDGCLISEYPEGSPTLKHQFIARNRIVAALADCLIITEAADKSGTMHTAQFALDLGIPVAAVPGPITSTQSQGTNQLIAEGALMVRSADDILQQIGISNQPQQQLSGLGENEQLILQLLTEGQRQGSEILELSGLKPAHYFQTMTQLELDGHIMQLGNDTWGRA